MVCIKFSAHPKIPVVSSELESMALDKAPEISTQQREASTERREESLTDQQRGASTEVHSLCDVESDRESQFGDSGDNGTTSDNSGHMKVSAAAALAGISYDFGPSKVTKTRIDQ
jgi:hypothetical protein